MKPTSFKESNLVLGAGGNPNTVDLVACIAVDHHTGAPFVISRWKLEPEELERVKETGEIWVAIMGRGMAPIFPMAHDPFKTHGFKPVNLEPPTMEGGEHEW